MQAVDIHNSYERYLRLLPLELCYFAIALTVVVATHWHQGVQGFAVFSTPDQIAAVPGPDYKSYILAARMFETRGIDTFITGGYGMFPPGLPLLDLAIMKLFAANLLIPVFLLTSTALWSMFMGALARTLSFCLAIDRRVAITLPLLLLAAPFFRDAYTWQSLLLTESISTPLFATGCVLAWRVGIVPPAPRHSWLWGLAIGLLCALAAYTRAQFDLMFTALVIASVGCLLLVTCLGRLGYMPSAALRSRFMAILACVVAYQALTVPYKIVKHAPTIVVIDYGYAATWHTQSDIRKMVGDWYADAGASTMCSLNPGKCDEFYRRRAAGETIKDAEYKSAALHTALHRPLKMLQLKIPYFLAAWSCDMIGLPDTYSKSAIAADKLFEKFLLVSIPITAAMLLVRSRKAALLYGLYAGAFIASATIFSLVMHIEPRYFLPIKMLGFVSFVVTLAWSADHWFKARKGHSAALV